MDQAGPESRSPVVPAVAPAAATASPATPPRTSPAFKWFIGGAAVLLLSVVACCGLAVFALSPIEGGSFGSYGDSIALIHVDGVIAGTGSEFDGVITPEAMLDKLGQALADPSVKAILLRIDSPGGTVAASQEIAIEVARASEEKPVIASIGDVGASGAYMIASQCDEIVAAPTAAVGSIGVITQIPNVAGLLDKLGVEFTVLTAGDYKDAGSPFRSMTATETALIQTEVDIAYDEFIRIVAEGRELPEPDVREMATGFAWSALVAKDMGLVDTLGNFNDAIDRAADLGGIEGEPYIVTYEDDSYGAFLRFLLGASARLDRIDALARTVTGPAAPALTR
ncbi:MAG: signal peptide peptidase SppA [Coriobacteriia bacterium]|nr:signal peptide peptidase SppA [Coriobacteriia bacterium]